MAAMGRAALVRSAGCGLLVAVLGVACGDADDAPVTSAEGGAPDAGGPTVVDGSTPPSSDGAPPDAAPPFAWPPPGPACTPTPDAPKLSETCLYSDIATRTVRSDVVAYEPAYALWSDGATKRRFVWLPPGLAIDTADMDHWQMPIGARFWKEFAQGGKTLETRLIARTGPDAYEMVSYVWRADGTDADRAPFGQNNVADTQHDVPNALVCKNCHDGEPGRVLGFSAVQLSKAPGAVTLQAVAAAGKLSTTVPAATDWSVPGDAVQAKALGYMHANCGHCHNPDGGEAYRLVDQILRLDVATNAGRDPTKTKTYTTTLGKKTTALFGKQSDTRVLPKNPEESDLWLRMGKREVYFPPPNMPPYGTEKVDPDGRGAVAAWIQSL